jgi:hypothetical protein
MDMAAAAHKRADLALIVRAIRRSTIRLMALLPIAPAPRRVVPELPPGYDLTDLIILEWLAAQAPRTGREYLRH